MAQYLEYKCGSVHYSIKSFILSLIRARQGTDLYKITTAAKRNNYRLQVMVNHLKYPAFYLTKASAKFAVAASNGFGGDAFTRKTLFEL